MFSLFLFFAICVSGKSNNAGQSKYHGVTNGWSNITLIPSIAKWTHFVYMIADNNLDWFAVSDLEEMRLNTATMDELNLVVYVDRCFGCDGSTYQANISSIYDCNTMKQINGRFNGSKILQKNGSIWCQIYDFGHELDSLQQQAVSGFTALMNQYQLTSTFFILEFWDHGGAWAGYGSDDHTAMSSENQSISTLNSLFNAISIGLEMTYLGRLDLLGFDACIMADYSVLHYLSKYDLTKYYLASEVSEPGVGWDYKGINASSTTTNIINYAISIIDSYVNQGNVQSSDAGDGYTLTLFDMNYVYKFLNEFDTLIRMITLAINNSDYGMIMSILRGESSTISAEKDFDIEDFGLFLQGLINENIYFDTCNDRIHLTATNVIEYMDESIIYFEADFVRQQMTGSTIFYSTNYSAINLYYWYNNDLSSDNYLTFLISMSTILSSLDVNMLTNISCHSPLPASDNDLEFDISIINIAYSDKYNFYQISSDVTPTVMNSITHIYERIINMNLSIALVSLQTNIIDKDFDNTQLISYWDGNIAYFIDNNNQSNIMYATGSITYVSVSKSEIPIGYIVKYPVYIYQSINDYKLNNGNASHTGYIKFEVILSSSRNITITDLKLYEIDPNYDVISEVSPSSAKIIQGISTVIYNKTEYIIPTGTLIWPDFSIYFYPFNLSTVIITGNDVFGNNDISIMDMINVNLSNWNITIKSTTTTTTTTTATDDNKSDDDTGLDVISGLIWLIMVSVLFALLVLFFVLWMRARKQSGLIIEHPIGGVNYVQMAD